MLLTLYYMYATLLQCWRISRTRAKLAAVSEQTAVLICRRDRCPSHVTEHPPILHTGDKLGYAVPKKKISLENWLSYSSFGSCLPGGTPDSSPCQLDSLIFPVLIEADLSSVSSADQVRLWELGQPHAWLVGERFRVLLYTDMEHFARLASCFLSTDIAIHEGMQVLRMETVEFDGVPNTLRLDRISKKLRWPRSLTTPHKHWRHLVEDLKTLCKKVNQSSISHNGAVCNDPRPPIDNRPNSKAHKFASDRRSHRSTKRERGKEMMNTGTTTHNRSRDVTKKDRSTYEKPPNVLVCADSGDARLNVMTALNAVLAPDTYALYELGTADAAHLLDSCTLVVVCGNVPMQLASHLLQYLLDGGQLLCLCSDLLNTVLHAFTTAEVREQEMVHLTYGRWKRIPMMHDIFCYQTSPSAERFSQDSETSCGLTTPQAPSIVEVRHAGITRTLHVRVLATEDTWHTPSILLARVHGSRGRAIFSQVHLETDPTRNHLDEARSAALRCANQARMEILADILVAHLDVSCVETDAYCRVTLKPPYGYLLGHNHIKQQLLEKLFKNGDGAILNLTTGKLSLQFCRKDIEPPIPGETVLPVLIQACSDNFSTVNYFEHLQTELLGRLVLYCDTLASSMDVICGGTFIHGFTVVSRRQTQGIGRAGNVWLSPDGCAMFSVQLHVSADDALFRALPLLQHAAAACVVAAVRELPGYERIDIGVKWPNDVYAYSRVKIGGVIVRSILRGVSGAICNVGIGVNLNNARPTTCINSLVRSHNETHSEQLNELSLEELIAITLTRLEQVLQEAQQGNLNSLYDMYYKYWLHSGTRITVRTGAHQLVDVLITGIDEHGYLMVQARDGSSSSVQPDGNSYDMLRGLIAPKIL